MRAILIDDEQLALDVLILELEKYDHVEIVGSYLDPVLALEEMSHTKPDVIFLDIEMGPFNGVVMAEDFIRKNKSVEIVFVTAYSQYAIEAFELNAVDYLLKPIQKSRLNKTIERLKERIDSIRVEVDEENLLRVDCFGNFEVFSTNGKPLLWRTQKSKELFAYLLIQRGNKVSKDLLMDTIFPEKNMEKAQALFHTTIYQLRKNLKALGFKESIVYSSGSYQLALPVDSNMERLDRLLVIKNHKTEDISKLLDIYEGDLFEYEGYQWAMGAQHKYRERISDILDDFIRMKIEKDIESPTLKRALEASYRIDPLNDKAAENIMIYYGKQGQISKLKDFYNHHKEELWKELDTKPTESTMKIFNKYAKTI